MDKKLIDYIKQNKKQGFSNEQIKKALLGAGWKEEDVDQGFKETKPKGKKKWIVIAIIILVLVGLASMTVVFNFEMIKGWFVKEEPGPEADCYKEGEMFTTMPTSTGVPRTKKCCRDLKSGESYTIINDECHWETDVGICINCPNDICGPGENKCNCPEDCEEDEFKDWKTYRNEEYGYEVKYPEDFPIDLKDLKNITIGTIPWEPGPGFINIKIVENKSTAQLINEMKNDPTSYEGLTEQEAKLDNLEAKKVIYKGAFAGEKHIIVLCENENYLYRIKYIEGDSQFNQKIDQILSAFKFLD